MKVQGLILVVILFYLAYTQLVKGQPRKDCQTRCGNVTVEYPFGISSGCYYVDADNSFNLTCINNETLSLSYSKMEVISIFGSGQLSILAPIAYACSDDKGNITTEKSTSIYIGNFLLSTDNNIIGVGCSGYVFMRGFGVKAKTTGCILDCFSNTSEDLCQISNSNLSNEFSVMARIFEIPKDSVSKDKNFSSCNFAVLVEDGKYDNSTSANLKNLRDVKKYPVVLDWSIGSETCEQVESNNLCGGNSICSNSTQRKGYICKCKNGYHGNPYLPNSCRDVDECIDNKHNCGDAKYCINTQGHFECKCPFFHHVVHGHGCTRKDIGWTIIVLGTTIGFLVLFLGVFCIKQRLRHRKDTELRKQFFLQNGGGMLSQRLTGAGPSNVDITIFTEEAMKTATNGYDKSRILGEGGQGTVYKGILPDNSVVAIKKARLGDSSQVEQFINEMLVLSQINHRNVVKLLGCCLETEVPLLVYEFITNGTLFDHLHASMFDSSLTWEHRLRIAIEVAGTLAYLHSSASIPIIHRDVKTANILLNEDLTSKVADFGASRLIPMDKEQLTTMVQGTLGYLDPEYYNTGMLNEKSDVYSFGVVLMELLSGQKAMCFERPQYSKHLVSYFTSATKENRLDEIIDGQLISADTHKEIQEVAKVAIWCTRLTRDERPRMKEVVAELEGLRVISTKYGKLNQYPQSEEIGHLPGGHILSSQGDTNGSGYDIIKTVPGLDIESGR